MVLKEPEDTNLYGASTEWCEEPYERSHNCLSKLQRYYRLENITNNNSSEFTRGFAFKHETFDALQCATDFGTISKESLKQITKWGAKYSTLHPSSYYPVPQPGMSFKDVRFMTPLPPGELSNRL